MDASVARAYGGSVVQHDVRFLDLAGAFNFRDLGGLPTADGASTRFGVLYRSDALHHLHRADIERLADLGVETIVDLRSAVEVERSGRGLLADTDIAWFHAPLSHGDPTAGNALPQSLVDGDLGRHYVDSLVERTEMLAAIVTRLAAPAHVPAVFHCTAGKDRTGMVAALVLSLVGVPDADIVDDYVLTDARMAPIMERIRTSGAFPEAALPLLANVGRAEAASMQTFLQELAARGGASAWADAAGITDATLTSLRHVLVERG
jgi:hypothetical protein